MRSLCSGLSALAVSIFISACSVLPDMPPDFALPVHEILLHSSCELQDAFKSLTAPEFNRFKPRQWLINMSLTPKVDTEITPGIGWIRKSPTTLNPARLTTWTIGAAPGIQFDGKGERTGTVYYTYKSSALMDDKSLDCTRSTPSINALAQHLGVGEWLRRTATAVSVAKSVNIDKPSYNSDITIKFSGSGSYTYLFTPGTDLASLAASYSLDEQLNISMTPIAETKKLKVVTLPVGENFKGPKEQQVITSVTTQSAQSRLDLIQIEQAIKSLQPRP
jgi:hypothetical protein